MRITQMLETAWNKTQTCKGSLPIPSLYHDAGSWQTDRHWKQAPFQSSFCSGANSKYHIARLSLCIFGTLSGITGMKTLIHCRGNGDEVWKKCSESSAGIGVGKCWRRSWTPPSLFRVEWNPTLWLGHFPSFGLLLWLFCANLSQSISFLCLSSFLNAFFPGDHYTQWMGRRHRWECT